MKKKKKTLNSLPNNKILDWSIESICRTQSDCDEKESKCILGWIENIVGKGENAGYQHFLFFPQCFQRASYSGSLNARIVW